ncbi:MAG: RNA methyltransferase [Bacteroidales bacterium]|jgi:23S rRNA (guanosine2251-2'-O)-methyltransferase|nr:RNA methyltransferase [Bacteroidales bacterium]
MRKLKNSELNRKTINNFKESKKNPIIVVLDNIRSLNNIGSVFRTSDAFLVNSIYLCGITAQPPHKDIHKTALGATESVDWKYFKTTKEAILELKKNDYKIISIEQAENSIELQDFKITKNNKYAFIFGHEVKGVQQEIIDLSNSCIEIPQYGTKHSFNISVSTGIVLWDIFNKL